MYRRRFLAGASMLLAGCGAARPLPPVTESPTPTRTTTATTTPTPTPTPEPLPFEISVDAPEIIAIENEFDIGVNVTNVSEQRNRFRRRIVKRWRGETEWTVAHVVDLDIDPGKTKQIVIPFAARSHVGTQLYRLAGTGVSWTIEITASEER